MKDSLGSTTSRKVVVNEDWIRINHSKASSLGEKYDPIREPLCDSEGASKAPVDYEAKTHWILRIKECKSESQGGMGGGAYVRMDLRPPIGEGYSATSGVVEYNQAPHDFLSQYRALYGQMRDMLFKKQISAKVCIPKPWGEGLGGADDG